MQVEPEGESLSPFDRLAAAEEALVDVLNRLAEQGYDAEFAIEPEAIPPGVCCRRCGRRHLPEHAEVLGLHRFEGPSSPDDEAVLIVLRCPRCGARGILVTAYGPTTSTEEALVLSALGTPAGTGSEQRE